MWLLVDVPRKQRQNEYIARVDSLTSQHLAKGAMSTKQHTKWIQRKWNSITKNINNVLHNNDYHFTDEDRQKVLRKFLDKVASRLCKRC